MEATQGPTIAALIALTQTISNLNQAMYDDITEASSGIDGGKSQSSFSIRASSKLRAAKKRMGRKRPIPETIDLSTVNDSSQPTEPEPPNLSNVNDSSQPAEPEPPDSATSKDDTNQSASTSQKHPGKRTGGIK